MILSQLTQHKWMNFCSTCLTPCDPSTSVLTQPKVRSPLSGEAGEVRAHPHDSLAWPQFEEGHIPSHSIPDASDPPLMMLFPSLMKSTALQVMLGTVMRSSSLDVSECHTLMSSWEHVANSSDVALRDRRDKWYFSFLRWANVCLTDKSFKSDHRTVNQVVQVNLTYSAPWWHKCKTLQKETE